MVRSLVRSAVSASKTLATGAGRAAGLRPGRRVRMRALRPLPARAACCGRHGQPDDRQPDRAAPVQELRPAAGVGGAARAWNCRDGARDVRRERPPVRLGGTAGRRRLASRRRLGPHSRCTRATRSDIVRCTQSCERGCDVQPAKEFWPPILSVFEISRPHDRY